jgi:hypothetical protein
MTTKEKLNEAVKAMGRVDRPQAVKILARFDVLTTAELKPESIPAVHAAFIEALKKSDASTP